MPQDRKNPVQRFVEKAVRQYTPLGRVAKALEDVSSGRSSRSGSSRRHPLDAKPGPLDRAAERKPARKRR